MVSNPFNCMQVRLVIQYYTDPIQGLSTLVLTSGLTVGYLLQPGGIESFTYAYDYWVPLLSVSLAFALLQNLFFWAQSYWSGELLALGGNSGHFFYDVCLPSIGIVMIDQFNSRAYQPVLPWSSSQPYCPRIPSMGYQDIQRSSTGAYRLDPPQRLVCLRAVRPHRSRY